MWYWQKKINEMFFILISLWDSWFCIILKIWTITNGILKKIIITKYIYIYNPELFYEWILYIIFTCP